MATRARSVQWRIMVWLLPLLALVFAGVLFWLSTVLQDALHANNLEIVRGSSRAAVASIETSMLGEHGDQPWSRLTRRIVEAGGRLRFARAGREDQPAPSAHDADPGAVSVAILRVSGVE